MAGQCPGKLLLTLRKLPLGYRCDTPCPVGREGGHQGRRLGKSMGEAVSCQLFRGWDAELSATWEPDRVK